MKKANITICLFILIPFLSHAQCYNLVWSDEFDGSSLNTAKWSYQVGAGGWGNNELQYYTNGANVEVSNGTLKIRAKQESFNGSNYTSSRILSQYKGDFRYGKFEARMKLPFGQGIWPAFWLMPTNSEYGTWPRSGEIDVMELLGHQPNIVYGTIHSGTSAGATVSSSANYTLPSGSFADDFHTFSIEWSPTEVKWLVDGTLYSTKTGSDISPWVFDKTFHAILNVAVGGNWPGAPNGTTVFPQTMEVDYVRIYQKLEDVQITGAALVEPAASSVYSLPTIANTTYAWSGGANATISSGQGTTQATMAFGSTENVTTLSATLSNGCGTATPQYSVTVSPNQWVNPDFENNLTNWNTSAYNGGAADFTISTTNPQQATKALCAAVTALGQYPWNVQVSRTAFNVTAGQSYTLTFWSKGDVAGLPFNFAFINANDFTLYAGGNRSTATVWTKQTFTFNPTVSTTVLFTIDLGTQTGTYCFDNFVFGKTELVVPVELIDFQAILKNKKVALTWEVAEEKNLKNYEIERSYNGVDFDILGFVAATKDKVYRFEDAEPLKPIGFYRLKMNDNDGRFAYSKILSVAVSDKTVFVFPNPTHDFIEIKNIETLKTIELFDQNGRLLRQFSSRPINRLDLRDVPKGIYQLRTTTEASFEVFKVVKM
ncbi:MAG: family 16 glycosylhydrolase [Saprospiraceae bacterium]|nr:family 16 glycosylhydrolase [Saprospiraceae bacterium]